MCFAYSLPHPMPVPPPFPPSFPPPFPPPTPTVFLPVALPVALMWLSHWKVSCEMTEFFQPRNKMALDIIFHRLHPDSRWPLTAPGPNGIAASFVISQHFPILPPTACTQLHSKAGLLSIPCLTLTIKNIQSGVCVSLQRPVDASRPIVLPDSTPHPAPHTVFCASATRFPGSPMSISDDDEALFQRR